MQSCISERVFYSSRRQRLHDADIIQSLYLAALFIYKPTNLRLQKQCKTYFYCNKIHVEALRFALDFQGNAWHSLPFEWQKWETNVLLPWLSNKNKGRKQINTVWKRVMIVMVCKLKVKKCHFTQKWTLQKMREIPDATRENLQGWNKEQRSPVLKLRAKDLQ